MGSRQTRLIIISSFILAACGVAKSPWPASIDAIENEVELGRHDEGAVLPEPASSASDFLLASPRLVPFETAQPVSMAPANRSFDSIGQSRSPADSASIASMPETEQPLATVPLIQSHRLSSYSIARIAKPWVINGLPPLWRVSQPAVPTVPLDSSPIMAAVLPTRMAAVPVKRLYFGQVKHQVPTEPCLVVDVDVTNGRVQGQYTLPVSEQVSKWAGFVFSAVLEGLTFKGEGYLLLDSGTDETVVLQVFGELSEDQQTLAGTYKVSGDAALQGTFAAEFYDFMMEDAWNESAEVLVQVETGQKSMVPTVDTNAIEIEPIEGHDEGVDFESRPIASSVPVPEHKTQNLPIVLYTEVDFVMAFPQVKGVFEHSIYGFKGFEHALVFGAYAWAKTPQDEPDDLTYFTEQGCLVGSTYGHGLPWYRVQYQA